MADMLTKRFDGWGTGLKPAYEPIILARKALDGTYAQNALKHGVAGLNIDGTRIPCNETLTGGSGKLWSHYRDDKLDEAQPKINDRKGRWPANLILNEEAAIMLDEQTGTLKSGSGPCHKKASSKGGSEYNALGKESRPYGTECSIYGDTGGASRFFYVTKASKSERGKYNNHPTVKPIKLMEELLDLVEYLCTLTSTPAGGTVLDPFCGSGSTALACMQIGRPFIGIERDPEYFKIACQRVKEFVPRDKSKKSPSEKKSHKNNLFEYE